MRFAYADPPYFGCGKMYAEHHPNALDWDRRETHFALIDRLKAEYPDGWALSCHEPSWHWLREYAGEGCRSGVWVKPFAAFKPNVNPAYAFEPVIWAGGRKRTRQQDTVRDWVAENITMKRGLTGAKPREFCRWIFALLNAQAGDTMDDLFPGTHTLGAAWAEWVGGLSPLPMLPLEATIGDYVVDYDLPTPEEIANG